MGFIDILIYRMHFSIQEKGFVEKSIQLLLNFSQNGEHYEEFIEKVSQEECLGIILEVFEKY